MHIQAACIPELELEIVVAHKVLHLDLGNVASPFADVLTRDDVRGTHCLQDLCKLRAAIARLSLLTWQGTDGA